MSLVWFVIQQRTEYKNIKIDQKECPNSIRNKIRNEFGFRFNTNFRIRNWRGNLVPINDSLVSNSRKNALGIELYVPKLRKKVSIDSIEKINRCSTALATKSIIYGFYQKLLRLETAFKFSQNQLQKKLDNVLKFYKLNFLMGKSKLIKLNLCFFLPIRYFLYLIFKFSLFKRLDDLESRIDFLEKRLIAVENINWQGSFKKPLLW